MISLFVCGILITIAVTFTLAVDAATTPFSAAKTFYNISDELGPNAALDGFGGLSGGGATSVLLWTYPEPQRSQILDYLFLPNFGASLHMLKVEIGGDAQSTDGAEPSHQHSYNDLNYERGYEWWLMVEAKKRNPDILIYGLSWAYPKWVSCSPPTDMTKCTDSIYSYPLQTANYILKWVEGARKVYGVEVDFLGIWNERPWNDTYVEILRDVLDTNGFQNTKIVAPDNAGWQFADDVLNSKTLAKAVYAIGSHYPGTHSDNNVRKTGKPAWASEDDSTYNNNIGAGCLARIINENYVNGNMTATINWNLIASYQKGTNWYRAGLANAFTPWNGGSYGMFSYSNKSQDLVSWTMGGMIWVAAHTTQFTSPQKWKYLLQQEYATSAGTSKNGGSGHLKQGGSYVTLKNFETGDFTIVIEKMSRDFSSCVRPVLMPYTTFNEEATIALSGDLLSNNNNRKITSLHLWKTHFAHYADDPEQQVEFEYQGMISIDPSSNSVRLNITVNSLYTVTTVATGKKGSYGQPANQPSLFPTTYADNFNDCRINGEAKYWTDQAGAFACIHESFASPLRGIVMQQQVPERPIGWTKTPPPHSLLGHRDMVNSSFQIDVNITNWYDGPPGQQKNPSVVLGTCVTRQNDVNGLLLWMQFDTPTSTSTSMFYICTSLDAAGYPELALFSGTLSAQNPIIINSYTTFKLQVDGDFLTVTINNEVFGGVQQNWNVKKSFFDLYGNSGWGAMIGTLDYGVYTKYDSVQLNSSYYNNRFASKAPQHSSSADGLVLHQLQQKLSPEQQQQPQAGDKICITQCSTEVGVESLSQFWFDVAPINGANSSSGTINKPQAGFIRLRSSPELCITATVPPTTTTSSEQPWWLVLDYCGKNNNNSSGDANTQRFSWFLDGISPDHERQTYIYLQQPKSAKIQQLCLDIYGQIAVVGQQMDAWSCNFGANQAFFYDFGGGGVNQIGNEWSATCVGVC